MQDEQSDLYAPRPFFAKKERKKAAEGESVRERG